MVSQIEIFPNEIFIEIFRYFNAKNLFQYFYNLNSRFNILIQSLNNLYLSTSSYYDIHITPFIDILFIHYKAQINLNYFTKLRHLYISQLTEELLEQLARNHLPYLEYLSIHSLDRIEEDRMSYLWNKIFSNSFPYLKSCCIYKMNSSSTSSSCLLSLRILKLGDMDIFIYKSILSSCPNLYLLKFTRIISNNKSKDVIIQHVKLKKLIIAIPWFEELSEDCEMDKYFSCIPNLEGLIVHRTNESRSLNEYFLKYDWYASLISLYLPLVTRFVYYFHVLKSHRDITEMILYRIQERFNHVHKKYLYQYKFIIDL